MGITGDKGDKGEIGPQGYLSKSFNFYSSMILKVYRPRGPAGDVDPAGLIGTQGVKGDKVGLFLEAHLQLEYGFILNF